MIFSIVTPSYNQGEFIEATIKSVLSQKGDFFIEYIIMDGGSTDNSIEIIKKYDDILKNKNWLKKCRGISYYWVSEKDEGQSAAIETGFERAAGDVGVWLNSDDIFYSDTVLQTVENHFNSGDFEMIIGNGTVMDKAGNFLWEHKTDLINFKELIFLSYHILQPSAFLKIQYLKDDPFDKKLYYTFDADFFIKLLASKITYKKVDENLSCFRLYPETKTLSGGYKHQQESIYIAKKYTNSKYLLGLAWLYKYLEAVIQIRFNGKIFTLLSSQVKKVFYLLVLGRWGRK